MGHGFIGGWPTLSPGFGEGWGVQSAGSLSFVYFSLGTIPIRSFRRRVATLSPGFGEGWGVQSAGSLSFVYFSLGTIPIRSLCRASQ
jgi:hypothetical protein